MMTQVENIYQILIAHNFLKYVISMLSLNRRMECDCELIKWNLVNEWTISKCWWKETVYRDWSVDEVMSKNVIIAWISISDWKRMKWWIWWWDGEKIKRTFWWLPKRIRFYSVPLVWWVVWLPLVWSVRLWMVIIEYTCDINAIYFLWLWSYEKRHKWARESENWVKPLSLKIIRDCGWEVRIYFGYIFANHEQNIFFTRITLKMRKWPFGQISGANIN